MSGDGLLHQAGDKGIAPLIHMPTFAGKLQISHP